MGQLFKLKGNPAICNQCIAKYGTKVKSPCDDVLKTRNNKINLQLKEIDNLKEQLATKDADLVTMIAQLQKTETAMLARPESCPEIKQEFNYMPFLVGGGALILLLSVAVFVLYYKLSKINQSPKVQLDEHLDKRIDDKFANWVKDHVIREEANYLDNEFTLRITKEGKYNGNQQHPRS